jgi:hypothetical protein
MNSKDIKQSSDKENIQADDFGIENRSDTTQNEDDLPF